MIYASNNPILAEQYHGDLVESRHRGCAIIMDATQGVVHAIGDPDQVVCIRSALKPLQAMLLAESDAMREFEVTLQELALACGSHDGEKFHVNTARAWLQRLGLTEASLACGSELPANREAMAVVVSSAETLTPAFNGCSGKHVGFLTVARHRDWPVDEYCAQDHPLQKAVINLIAERAGVNPQSIAINQDYCNAPNLFLPLVNFARACTTLLGDNGGAKRLVQAMMAHPEMVGGTAQYATRCMQALAGRAAVKCGAEGVMLVLLPSDGLVILVKIDDGAGRAAEIVTTGLLKDLGALDRVGLAAMRNDLERPLVSSSGTHIGSLRCCIGLRQ